MQAARDAVDAVLRDRGLRRVSVEQQAAARIAGARSTAEIESGGTGDAERWLTGALRVYAELTELAGSVRSSPPQVFARAHTLLARGLVPDERLGRLQDSAAVTGRMAGLASLLTARSEAPVIVLAAVAHAELAIVSPFGTGDGVVARAVEHMILIDGGVDSPAVIVPEAGHLAAGDHYRSGLSRYAEGTTAGVRDWLLHCAAAVARGAEESPVRAG